MSCHAMRVLDSFLILSVLFFTYIIIKSYCVVEDETAELTRYP